MNTYEIWYWSSATRTLPAVEARYKEFSAATPYDAVDQLSALLRDDFGHRDRVFTFRVYGETGPIGNFYL